MNSNFKIGIDVCIALWYHKGVQGTMQATFWLSFFGIPYAVQGVIYTRNEQTEFSQCADAIKSPPQKLGDGNT
jgi:hypothetical protein